MYNAGTRQMHSKNSAGLNVINIGVSHLNRAIRTDLANRLLILQEESLQPLQLCFHTSTYEDSLKQYYVSLIDKLLQDIPPSDYSELVKLRQSEKLNNSEQTSTRLPSTSTNHSQYFAQNAENVA
jgi:hypothetical protein